MLFYHKASESKQLCFSSARGSSPFTWAASPPRTQKKKSSVSSVITIPRRRSRESCTGGNLSRIMSDMKASDTNDEVVGDPSEGLETPDLNEENSMPSSQEEEEAIKKKYGGILRKKPPLIAKDHERAFFDSADWALGKQGVEKHKLQPKLQPTQQQARSRRSPYASTENEDGSNAAPEDVNKE